MHIQKAIMEELTNMASICCNLIEKAKNDPKWDSKTNYTLCNGDCLKCSHLIKKNEEMNCQKQL